ncbi:MAG: S8 family serine peptidase [Streptosporangiales bacterium]|nr:S8 family serine peptidase [Streptosporangiales bacterium]
MKRHYRSCGDRGEKLKRRRLLAASVLAGVSALTLANIPAAQAEPPTSGFERLDSVVNRAGFRPAALNPDRKVRVILQLAGDSVGRQAATERLSSAARADARSALENRQNPVRSAVRGLGGTVNLDYQDAFNGLSVTVPASSLDDLEARDDVVAVHPVREVKRENAAGVPFIEGPKTWGDLGRTGKGVKVAVVDTGVDYTHAQVGGSGNPADFENNDGTTVEPGTFPTAKVVGGFDFAGDEYDAGSDDPARTVPKPDPDPLDCNGHGSHVAGTAAGNGVLADGSRFAGPYDADTPSRQFKIGPGVAPEADILAYRVFGCEGSANDDVIVAALNQALKDGADVVNMSLGSSFGRATSPDSVAVDTLSRAGVTVVASAGNDGPGAYITGSPAAATRGISVAALDATSPTVPAANLTLPDGNLLARNNNGAELPPELPVAVLRTSYPNGPVALGCSVDEFRNFPGGVEGKLVVTVRGTCARAARAVYGQQAGAAGVLMVNTDTSYPPFEGPINENPDTGEPFEVTIPFLGVRGVLGTGATDDGDRLVAADGQTVQLAATEAPNPGYKSMASFSSGGPRSGDSAMKPDVTAPGVSVVSTGVGTGTEPATISGTSMASPMTAGAAALVAQAHPDWNPEMIKGALIGTANATADKINGYEPRLAGSGVVDTRKATATSVVATTAGGLGSLAYGADELTRGVAQSQSLSLRNTGTRPVTYDLAGAFTGNALGADVSVSPSTVTVQPGQRVSTRVTLSLSGSDVRNLPAATTNNFGVVNVVRGVVTATPRTPGEGVYPLRVPFQAVPQGLSDVRTGKVSGGADEKQIPVRNSGAHAGVAELYSWGLSDPRDVVAGERDIDVRSAGVASVPGTDFGGEASDRGLLFAVNNQERWSTPASTEIDIEIDNNGDGTTDFIVVGIDLGAITAGAFDGRFASVILKPDGTVVGAWEATAPMNGSTAVLPALASEVGLAEGSSEFTYTVTTFSLLNSGVSDSAGSAKWDSHKPPVGTGDTATLAPGAGATFTAAVDQAQLARIPVRGWLVVAFDDRSGNGEADTVRLPGTTADPRQVTGSLPDAPKLEDPQTAVPKPKLPLEGVTNPGG